MVATTSAFADQSVSLGAMGKAMLLLTTNHGTVLMHYSNRGYSTTTLLVELASRASRVALLRVVESSTSYYSL